MSDNTQPRATVGVYVFNEAGEIFLAKGGRWDGLLIPPGGHIDYGERAADAAVREVKEETGLDVKDARVIDQIDMIEPPQFSKKGHFVGLQFTAKLIDESQEPVVDGVECTDCLWLKPEDIVRRDDVEPMTQEIIRKHFIKPTQTFEQIATERDEYKSGWQRAQADYKNLLKQVEEKKSQWVKMSTVQAIEEFLPVYSNFKKCFDTEPTDEKQWENWKKGVEYIMKQFADVMNRHGITEIPTVGEQFDPEKHEAMGEEESDKPTGTILKEIDTGYAVDNKTIKAAKVIVAA